MSLSAYQLFCAIAEHKNMTKAAEQLNITPSAASHALSKLEREFGFELFVRDRSGAVLTRNGALVLPRIRAILAEDARLHEEVSQIGGLEKGTVSVGVFDSVCTHWLPGILGAFGDKYPQIEVRIYQEGYKEIENLLLEGLLDIGFVSLPTSDKFSTVTLAHDRLLCVTPADFVPANRVYMTPEDLRSFTLILSQRGYDRAIEAFVRANELETGTQHYITLESSVIALVESGMGCSIMPELMIEGWRGRFSVYPLLDNTHRTIALATLKNQSNSPACNKMIEEIRTYVEKNQTHS